MAALSSIALGVVAAASLGSAYVSYESGEKAEAEASRQQAEQAKLSAEARREQAKQAEITGAEAQRTDAKTKARKVRSISGGGLLTGGETGLMKTKLGE